MTHLIPEECEGASQVVASGPQEAHALTQPHEVTHVAVGRNTDAEAARPVSRIDTHHVHATPEHMERGAIGGRGIVALDAQRSMCRNSDSPLAYVRSHHKELKQPTLDGYFHPLHLIRQWAPQTRNRVQPKLASSRYSAHMEVLT